MKVCVAIRTDTDQKRKAIKILQEFITTGCQQDQTVSIIFSALPERVNWKILDYARTTTVARTQNPHTINCEHKSGIVVENSGGRI